MKVHAARIFIGAVGTTPKRTVRYLVFTIHITDMSMIPIRNNLLVIKEGTETILNGGAAPDPRVATDTAAQIAELWDRGIVSVLVTSSAIEAGRAHCRLHGRDDSRYTKSSLAAVGAWPLLSYWGNALLKHGLLMGQGWITYASLSHPLERAMFEGGVKELLSLRTVPVVNENDFLADDEIRALEDGISDNDSLAARVALLVKAGAALFLSDTDGFYEEDPKVRPDAGRYKEVNARDIPPLLLAAHAGPRSRGGVKSKVLSAAACAKSGMYVRVSRLVVGKRTIVRSLEGEAIGTLVGRETILL